MIMCRSTSEKYWNMVIVDGMKFAVFYCIIVYMCMVPLNTRRVHN